MMNMTSKLVHFPDNPSVTSASATHSFIIHRPRFARFPRRVVLLNRFEDLGNTRDEIYVDNFMSSVRPHPLFFFLFPRIRRLDEDR